MPSSYTFTHSLEAAVDPGAVWALYDDVASWPQWDAGAERITRDGPFTTGVTGTMKLVGQDPMPYRLAKVVPGREFVDETPVGDLVVRVAHRLQPLEDGRLRLTYDVAIDGPAEQAQAVGPLITGDFPDTMAAVLQLAAERSA